MVRERTHRERPARPETERVPWSYAHASPHVHRSVYGTPPAPVPSAPFTTPRRSRISTPVAASPLQRKGAYVSPSVTTHVPTPTGKSKMEDLDTLAQWPSILLAHAQGWWMDLQSFVHKPELGVPVGVFLHVLSLLTQLLLPGSAFSGGRRSAGTLRHASHLFASHTRPTSDTSGLKAYTEHLSRMILSQRHAAQRYTSRILSLALCAVAIYNAYLLFSKYRTYRLWYRQAQVRTRCLLSQDLVRNPHARLEAPPTAAPPPRPWSEWVKHIGLLLARQIPVVEWFVPAPAVHDARPISASERIYTLRVWDVYEAPLWLFTVAGSLGLHPVVTWLLTATMLALFSAQAYMLAREYEALLKDRQLLQSEMLHEYDEKVCGVC
ncbi:hypothetical protein MEQU1_001960 [Malassezia equina]|uniref:Nuclear rim protein 1 n=1 Tax=Malassezia equina TaxID=1381935 RepID=A0AAF0IYV4_9BASI|nr:hypothetical protein MEQU1_001960 [Malassezia equina]